MEAADRLNQLGQIAADLGLCAGRNILVREIEEGLDVGGQAEQVLTQPSALLGQTARHLFPGQTQAARTLGLDQVKNRLGL